MPRHAAAPREFLPADVALIRLTIGNNKKVKNNWVEYADAENSPMPRHAAAKVSNAYVPFILINKGKGK